MFGPKKPRLSKTDLKKSIVSANNKLVAANDRLKLDIKANEEKFSLIEKDYLSYKKLLEDIKSEKMITNGNLVNMQKELLSAENDVKKALSKVEALYSEARDIEKNNQDLQKKNDDLVVSVTILETKQSEFGDISLALDDVKDQELEYNERLKLLSKRLEKIELEVESYEHRKSVVEGEFTTFKGEIDRSKRIAEEQLKDVLNLTDEMKLKHGQEMANLDHAIAERMTEINDMKDLLREKDYEFLTIQSKIDDIKREVKDAEGRIEYSVKSEKDKVDRVKQNFKQWKLDVLDEVARMKLKGKIKNIETAGLKELLDG